MIQRKTQSVSNTTFQRNWLQYGAVLALSGVLLFGAVGCDEEAAAQAFRSTASSSLQSGVNSIMDGIVDGLFAAFELTEADSADADTAAQATGGDAAAG